MNRIEYALRLIAGKQQTAEEIKPERESGPGIIQTLRTPIRREVSDENNNRNRACGSVPSAR
jgi:hypothetical protein